ncbi:hypothetical protein ES703_95062 [subsurface metagenome]
MSKTIKLEDQVYNRLEELRGKRETFSQCVARLLEISRKVASLMPLTHLENKEEVLSR